MQYTRFVDDLVVLIDAHPRNRWLRKLVPERIREEISKLGLQLNEDKSRVVDLHQEQSFGFLGFRFSLVRSHAGRMMALLVPQLKKRTALYRKLKEVFQRFESQPVTRVIELINPMLWG